MKLSDIRVVIMGASSGIGAATALAFAREGAQLVLGARGKEGLEDIAQRCRQAGGNAEALGAPATLLRLGNFAAPNLMAAGMNRFLDAWAKRAERVPGTRGALYEPPRGASGIHSGQRRPEQVQVQVQVQHNKALVVGVAALAAAVGVQLWRRRG